MHVDMCIHTAWLKGLACSRRLKNHHLRRAPKSLHHIHVSPVMSNEYSSGISLTPISTSVSSSRTTLWRSHEMRTMALGPQWTLSKVMSLTCSAFLYIFRSFQGSDINRNCNLGIDREESANAEIDDEHNRHALAWRSRSQSATKLNTRKKKVCFDVHRQFSQAGGDPSSCRYGNESRNKSWMMKE